ncbi:hypothetical protein F383_18193 [Gossypium arboreum]|uniref:Uncharacterized protein n=1 Tax=Gossypium arboreum TaxID=29729 RepID=A0A0B0NLG8_GOSAR|nr:hypothetical protein F383_18193 [Gossypium arboreum]
MFLYLGEHKGVKRAKNKPKSDKKNYFQYPHGLGISIRAGHTPMC